MSVTEYERHQIFQWYEEAMGSERATIMMNLVPPVGWGEVATRTELVALGHGLRGEMSALRSELRGEMSVLGSELRGEMSVLGSELRGEMSALGSELRGEMAALRGEMAELRGEMAELRGEMKAGHAELLRLLFFGMVASNVTLVGLVLAAVKLA